MTIHENSTEPADGGLVLPSAADIRGIIERSKAAKIAETNKEKIVADEELKHRKEMFLAQKLTPDIIDRIMTRVKNAAENGETEILLGHFPSAWCSDGGREINAREEGWPETLQGFAREFYEFWEKDLKPTGFHLSVEIVSFPGGMPGDVGATLSWSS